jgi:hypothetical protein
MRSRPVRKSVSQAVVIETASARKEMTIDSPFMADRS